MKSSAGGEVAETATPQSDSLAWEINFSEVDGGKPKRATSIPKFIRDRQRERSSIPTSQPMKSRSSEDSRTPRRSSGGFAKPPAGSTTPPIKSSTGPTRLPGRSSTSPIKVQTKTVSKPTTKSASSILSRSQSTFSRLESSKPISPPKKPPTIKKSLLPVRKGDKMLEMRSRSDCSLTVGGAKTVPKNTSTPSKVGTMATKKRPSTAPASRAQQRKSSIPRPSRGLSAGGDGTSSHRGTQEDRVEVCAACNTNV